MNKYFNTIKSYAVAHKVISGILIVVVVGGGYWEYKKTTNTSQETRYVLAAVKRDTIVSSITGTGQVSALSQVDIKPNVSGAITRIYVKPGDAVRSGQILFSLDSTNAQKAVRDAEANLESAQISADKLKIQESNDNMNTSLAQAYDDGFNTVSGVFLDLPGIMTGLDNMFFKSTIVYNGPWNIDWYEAQVTTSDQREKVEILKQDLTDAYNTALAAYNKSEDIYKSASRTSDTTTIDSLISTTYDTTKAISDAVKDANNYLDFINDSMQENNATIPAVIGTDKTSLGTYTSKCNTDLINLLSTETTIKNDKDAFPNSVLDIQSSNLGLKQKENALQDAKDNLADYTIRAPFDGTIASVPAQLGDTAGSGTALATIITSTKLAVIPFNEVDVAKIQLGQKAILTFDAIPDLTISGKVVQIDSVGTVSQGVVNYNIKISFDTDSDQVKPGMSVNVAIITSVEQDVLSVPNSALKTQGGSSYVEMFDAPLPTPAAGVQGAPSPIPPRQQSVQIGISSDTSTEIISGLNEGDQIVVKTITGTTTTAAVTAPSLFGAGGNRGGGGAIRIPNARGD